MNEERLDIVVTDRVAASIETKLLGIAAAAELSNEQLTAMRATLAAVLPHLRSVRSEAIVAGRSVRAFSSAAKSTTPGLTAVDRALRRVLPQLERTSALVMQGTSAYDANATALDRMTNSMREYMLVAAAPTAAPAMAMFPSTNVASRGAAGSAGVGSGAAAAYMLNPAHGVLNTSNEASAALNSYVGAAERATVATVSLGAALRFMFLTYFAVAAAQRILTLADAYTEMSNKLRVVSRDAQAASGQLDRLYHIAQESRTSLDATVVLYQRLSLGMRHLNVASTDVERVVSTVNKALIAGGATAQETTSAVRQLSQAFNKGKADGDEFRSLMENAPMLMDLVAQEMGVARHELLGMAEQGLITAEVMFRAFSDGSEVTRAYNAMTLTLGHSITKLNNSLTMSFGKLNKVTHATEILAGVIGALADNVDVLTVAVAGLVTGLIALKLPLSILAVATAEFTLALGVLLVTARAGIAVGQWLRSITHPLPAEFNEATTSLKQYNAEAQAFLKLREQQRAHEALANKYGESRAAVLEWLEGHKIAAVTVEHSIASTEAATLVQEYLNEAKEEGITVTALLASEMMRVATVTANNIQLERAIAQEYANADGAVAALVVQQTALQRLYAEVGTEVYKRRLEEVTAQLDELRRTQAMTTEELERYLAAKDRATALEALEASVTAQTTGRREQLAELMRIVNERRARGNMLEADAVRLLQQYNAELDRMNGLVPKTPTAVARQRTEQSPFDRAYTTAYERTADAAEQLRGRLQALNDLYKDGFVGREAYMQQLATINAEMLVLDIRAGKATSGVDALKLAFYDFIAETPNALEELASTYTTALQQMTAGVGDLVAQWALFREKMDFADMFRSVLRQMIVSLVDLAAQMLVNITLAAILRSLGGMGTYTGAPTSATVQGPPTPPGLATSGASAPTSAGTAALYSQMVATVAKSSRLAQTAAAASSAAPQVVIQNESGVSLEVATISPSEVRLIARDVVRQEAAGTVAGAISDPNSVVSRSLRRHTQAGRRGA